MEFESHTASYGPCFFHFNIIIYGQSANHKGHELKWKKQGVVTYNVHRENKVSKMFIINYLMEIQ